MFCDLANFVKELIKTRKYPGICVCWTHRASLNGLPLASKSAKVSLTVNESKMKYMDPKITVLRLRQWKLLIVGTPLPTNENLLPIGGSMVGYYYKMEKEIDREKDRKIGTTTINLICVAVELKWNTTNVLQCRLHLYLRCVWLIYFRPLNFLIKLKNMNKMLIWLMSFHLD